MGIHDELRAQFNMPLKAQKKKNDFPAQHRLGHLRSWENLLANHSIGRYFKRWRSCDPAKQMSSERTGAREAGGMEKVKRERNTGPWQPAG